MKKTLMLFLIGICFLALPVRAQINLLHEFAGGPGDGANPFGSMILSGSTLYGVTTNGGENDYGTIFKVQTDGSSFALLHEFTGNAGDGINPVGSLVLSGTTLYGMTRMGGENAYGMVFKIETNGSGFAILYEFSGGTDDGKWPDGSLIISGDTLYGMTPYGGESDCGIIFKMNSDGTNFTQLHGFVGDGSDGTFPCESLALSGSTLFGLTWQGGVNNLGTIFTIQTDGSSYSLLHEFAGGVDDGAYPSGSLIISDSMLYGVTRGGGEVSAGMIFKMHIDGGDIFLLHKFIGGAHDGALPRGSLILSGSTLFGMTYWGGNYDCGTIFKLETDGNNFTLLHDFYPSTADGEFPRGSLTISGTTLFGMTPMGGDSNKGVVFSLPLYTISGTVTHDGSPLANVVMDGLAGNPVTNGSGYYSATVASGWSGTVTPTRQNYDFSPSSTSYTGIDANKTTDYTATLSQPLVITAPSASWQWEKGRTHAITWLKQAAQNANVKIALFKDANTLVQMIANATANDGSYDWSIPANLAVGHNYFIRVRTLDNLISDFSDKFSIIVPKISLTAPTAGAVWVRGTTRAITWSKVGAQDAGVRILLYKDGIKKLDIALSAPNSGVYEWAIPSALARGLYTVRVRTLDDKVTGTSKAFTIARN